MAWLCHSRGFPATFLRPLRTCKNQAAKQQTFLDILSKVWTIATSNPQTLRKKIQPFPFPDFCERALANSFPPPWSFTQDIPLSTKMSNSPLPPWLNAIDISMTCRQKCGGSLRVFGHLCERRSVWGYLLSTAKNCSNMSLQCHTTNINKRHEGSLQETT